MALKYNKTVILAKLEASYGTGVEPEAGDALLITEASIEPVAGETVSRDFIRPTFGASPSIPVNTHTKVSFAVELASSGTAGSAPSWGKLLQACGMVETLTAAGNKGSQASAAYKPRSTDGKSVTIYYNVDGLMWKIPGCRGTMSLEANNNQLPMLKFEFMGLGVRSAEQTAATADFSAWKNPLPITKDNTTFNLHSTSAELASLTINLGQEVIHKDMPGYKGVSVSDRQTTGTISIRAPDASGKNYFNAVLDATQGELSFVHGKTAGKIVEVTAPKVQLSNPQMSEDAGEVMLGTDITFLPQTGDDELVITAK